MKTPNIIKAVILDVDQTLTSDTGSWLEFTYLLGADPKVHSDIYERFKSGKLDYINAKKELISLWKASGRTGRQEIENIFQRIRIRPGVPGAINYLKKKYVIGLISGAIDTFVKIIANRLDIDDYYAATEFIFDKNDELTDFNYKLGRGEEKLKFFEDFCNKYHLKESECAAIGDGDSDMPIFEKVGRPILFVASETSERQISRIKYHLTDWAHIYDLL
jgi:phosphoserine phosphatase